MKRAIAALLLLVLPGAAAAQSPPYVYAIAIGTAQSTVLPQNNARKRVVFTNPNPAAKVAICPSGPARGPAGATVVAAVNGSGCMTLLPYAELVVDGGGLPTMLAMPSSWIAVADTAASALTIFEFE